ncbi:MAG: cellulase family glycosylhydrolase [Sphingobacteriaceae bacterium]
MKRILLFSLIWLQSLSMVSIANTFTWDFNNPLSSGKADGWSIVGYTNAGTSNGILNLTAQANSNIRYDEYTNPYNPQYYKYVIIRLKNPTTQTKARFYWWGVNNNTAYYSEFTISANDTGFKEYVINLGNISNWTAQTAGIRIIRFDLPSSVESASVGKVINVDYIKLSAYAPMPVTSGKPSGVNLAGAEFGAVPGNDYSYPTTAELDYFQSKGLTLFRMPFKWERIQPTLMGALNQTELTSMKNFVEAARARGLWVILDMHNYCRRTYNGDTTIIGDPSLTIAHVADAWKKLALEFKSWDNIYGYGIMNEPNNMLSSTPWFNIAQGIISEIRTVDMKTTIMVGGDDWSSAMNWPIASDNLKNLNDPANNLIFEAHIYFDKHAGGSYQQSYDLEEAAHNTGVVRVAPFVKWLKANNLKGFVGEYGVPNTDSRWLVTLDNMLNYLKENCVNGTYWAAGPRWGSYVLSVEPLNGQDRVQMSVLQNYTYTNSSCGSTLSDSRSLMHNWEFNKAVASNKVEGWTIVNYANPSTANSILNLTTNVSYNHIKYDVTPLDPINTNLHKYAIIRLKNNTNQTQAAFYWHDYTSYYNVTFNITANDTAFKDYIIDLSQVTNWTSKSNIKIIRFDVPFGAITGSIGRTVSVDYIKLATSSPVGFSALSTVSSVNNTEPVLNDLVVYSKSFIVAPNPVENSVQLHLDTENSNLKAKLLTMDGRVVLDVEGSLAQINGALNGQIPGLIPGIYVIRLIDKDQTYIQKLIKK